MCLNFPLFKPWHGHFESLTCVAWSLRNDELPQKICRAGEKLVSCVGVGGIEAGKCLIWKITSSPPVAGHRGAQHPGPALLRLFSGLPRRPSAGGSGVPRVCESALGEDGE